MAKEMKMKPIMMIIMAVIVIASLVYGVQGIKMHAQVTVEEDKFHALQAEYFNQNKNLRDNAATGSALNQQLIEIQNYPSELLRLKLVGVGKMLTGIAILLLAILIALMMMPMKLASIIKKR